MWLESNRERVIISIGSTCVDFFIPLPSFPIENGKYRIEYKKYISSKLKDQKASQDISGKCFSSEKSSGNITNCNDVGSHGNEKGNCHNVGSHKGNNCDKACSQSYRNEDSEIENLTELKGDMPWKMSDSVRHRMKVESNPLSSIGGNVSNFIYMYSRLAARHNIKNTIAHLCTVIADDLVSCCIREWHHKIFRETNGILNIDYVVTRKGDNLTSPLTYILVVKDTRTCIHLPCEELRHLNPEDDFRVLEELEEICKDKDVWLYSDTRHGGLVNVFLTHDSWKKMNIPLILDCEKWRGDPMITQLQNVVYCFTNSDFPQKFWEEYLGRDSASYTVHDASMELWYMRRNKHGFMLRTIGHLGSYIITLPQPDTDDYVNPYSATQWKDEFPYEVDPHIYDSLDEIISKMEKEETNVPEVYIGSFRGTRKNPCNTSKGGDSSHQGSKLNTEIFTFIYCTAQRQPLSIDTTGAGDSFIGSFTFYLQHTSLPLHAIQVLASKCASYCLVNFGNKFEIPDEHFEYLQHLSK